MWRDGLWYKLWDMGVKGRIGHLIKKMYESSRSVVLVERKILDLCNVQQDMAQCCSLIIPNIILSIH